jgi:hypothetical protein
LAGIAAAEEGAMELTLNDDDARLLRDFLRDHFHDLQLEVARTEVKDLRHLLLARQDLVERLLARLEREVPT